MLALIKSHTDFLKAAHSTIAPATWPSIAAAHATKLQASISNLVSVDVQDAASALAMLSDSCFDEESKASIAASINTRVSGPASESSTCRTSLKTQEHLFFGNYLTACDWHVLGSPGSCMDDRIGTIVERAWRVGLLSMTERTSQSITCVIMSSFAGDVDPSHCHQVMLDMKAAFRQMRLKRSSACLPTLAKFPESVDQFMLQCPGKYDASDMPVPPKCDATKMNRLRSNLACRKSHTTLRDTSAAMPSSGSNAMMMQALPLLQALCNGMQGRRGYGDIPLVFTPAKRHRAPPSALALCDADTRGEGSPSDPMLMDDDAFPPPTAASVAAPAVVPTPLAPEKQLGVSAAAAAIQGAIAQKCAAAKAKAKGKAKDKAKAKAAATTAAADDVSGVPLPKAKGKVTAKAKAKGKAKAKAVAKAAAADDTKAASPPKAKGKVMAKAGAKAPVVAAAGYGCSKCRGSPAGCTRCRDPHFAGRHVHKK